jgi:5-methylcytosine-specific restriction endonuclease McrA
MWRGRGTLPEGQAICQPCRRERPQPYGIRIEARKPRLCVTCGETFKPRLADQRACSNKCRVRIEAPAPCDDCGELTEREGNQFGRFCATCSKRRARIRDRRKDKGWTLKHLLPSVRAVATRDNYICHVCGGAVDMSLPFNDGMAATRDHIIPRSAGGSHDPSNLKLAHRSCNSRRGAPLPV